MTPSVVGFSKKQVYSLTHSTSKINIWEGSVRSGKTYISLWRFLDEVLNSKTSGQFLMLAKTYDTFNRNIFKVLEQIVGTDAKYYSGKRELQLFGRTINVVGCDDDSSERKIRGLTASGAYVDEATIIPESVWKQLISRCAMGGARIFATTNPDSPYHWLKRDYLTNNPDVSSFQFRLDDNPHLCKADKDYLCRQYKGLWYQRFIEGLWVQAEGAIYDCFEKELHVIPHGPANADYYVLGVDYGTSLACSFILVGVNRSKFPNVWVESEYYWDSKVKQRQKTDSEYCDDLKKMIAYKNVKAIYVDPSAASFKVELQKQGVTNLYDAQNEVIDGIRMVHSYLDNGTLKICEACTNLIDEIQGYVWDSSAQKIGREKPLKQNDHACVVGSTKVLTTKGYVRIDELPRKGKLWNYNAETHEFEIDEYENPTLTRKNAEVCALYLEDGSVVCGTGDHYIMTSKGYEMLGDLTQEDYVVTNSSKHRLSKKKRLEALPNEDVFCLATKKNGNFIANGIVVKNCDALRYAIYSHFFKKELGTMTPQDLDRMYREAVGGNDIPDVFQMPRF